MGERTRYNDFARFLALHFPFKVQKISLNVGFTCPNRDGVKGYEDVPIAITRPLIRHIVGQTSLLRSSWRKEKSFLPENIRK